MSMEAMAIAVRNAIQAVSPYVDAPFLGRQVQVEFDERAPATAGDLYIIVTAGGEGEGENNQTGLLSHHEYGIDVAIAIRSPVKPRDRKREIWIDLTNSLRFHVRTITVLIHMQYIVMQAANTLITAEEGGSPCGFYKPLAYEGVGPVREAPAEIFAGVTGETQAALIQTIRFRGAMRLEEVTIRVP